jgi:spectrin beta
LAIWLSEADRLQQFFQDANEAESWIRERLPLARSEDLGRDIHTAESQWRRHRQLEKEVGAYRTEMQRLDGLAEELAQQAKFTQGRMAQNGNGNGNEEEEEMAEQQQEMMVPKAMVIEENGEGKLNGKGNKRIYNC